MAAAEQAVRREKSAGPLKPSPLTQEGAGFHLKN
jgi:hypothetical protein